MAKADGCVPTTTPTYTNTPCSPGGGAGYSLITAAGGAVIDWTAPNKIVGSANSADLDDLEDLAVWGESYGIYGLGGSGALHTSGLFMLPNADLSIAGSAAFNDVKDSQFIVRRLSTNGGGNSRCVRSHRCRSGFRRSPTNWSADPT